MIMTKLEQVSKLRMELKSALFVIVIRALTVTNIKTL